MPRLLLLAALLTLLGAACSGGSSTKASITLIPGNSELVPGPNRFAMALIDNDNLPVLGTGGTSVRLAFSFDGEAKFEEDATFVWAIPDTNGFWTADVDFDTAGSWEAEATLTRDGEVSKDSLPFSVVPDTETPHVGEAVPPADNITLEGESNIKKISTDDEPDQAFYQMTIREAIDEHKPFVVVFATPAFCQTQFCGPVLDNVKAVRPAYADEVNFIHVEPFVLDEEGQLLASPQGGPTISSSMGAWHLQTEPWVFVVGGDGKVVARFEGAASEAELTAAIDGALSG